MVLTALLATPWAAGQAAPQAKAAPPTAPAEEVGEFEFDPAQKPKADSRPVFVYNPANRTGTAYLSGAVEWSYEYQKMPVRLHADRLIIFVTLGDEGAEQRKDGREDASKRKEGRREDGALARIREFTFHAQGNVRLEVPSKQTYLEADSLFYEHATGRAVARGARLKTMARTARSLIGTTESSSFRPGPESPATGTDRFANTPLSIHARELRMTGFERFQGEGIEVSSCDFAVPHFALAAETVDVYPVEEEGGAATKEPGPAAPDPSALEGKDFIIDPEGTHFDLYGHHVVPLPVSHWDTRWNAWQPIRKVDVGHSSKFGYYFGVDWNVNWLLAHIPPERFLPLEVVNKDAEIDFETDYLEKRGFGYGPKTRYGKDPGGWLPWQLQLDQWNHYGEARYYAIDDHGDEDRSTGLPPPREHRYWGQVLHRQSIPRLGTVDVEFSKLSDPAFLGEYYESIAKEEKEQESLVYWRRNFRDNLALAALYEYRVNDFQPETERLPEGKLFLLDEPVFRSGFYTSVSAQSAYLHKLEPDALGIPPRGFGRHDMLNEWAYPLGLPPYIQTRPFFFYRLSHYDEVLDPAQGSEDRASLGGGITASQEWSRIYRLAPDSAARRLLGWSTLKHVLVPQVTYTNLFVNDLSSDELVSVDATDEVDLNESVAFSLRNAFYTRVPTPRTPPAVKPILPQAEGAPPPDLTRSVFETRSLLDSEVSFVLFPQPNRDNEGDRSSLLLLDNTVTIVPRTALRAWIELDPNRDFRMDRSDLSLAWEAIAGRLNLIVGDRFTRERTNFIYGIASVRLTEKWHAEAYYSHDFETGLNNDISFGVSRFFHRFVLSLEVSQDVGEDRNTTVHFNFMPVEFFKARGSQRSW